MFLGPLGNLIFVTLDSVDLHECWGNRLAEQISSRNSADDLAILPDDEMGNSAFEIRLRLPSDSIA